jgi:hypothetical protein
MAQDSIRSRSKYSRHPPSLAREEAAPGGVHPALDLVQAPYQHPSRYRPLLETESEQLVPSHHPMLPTSKDRNRALPLAKPHKRSIIGFVCGLGGHAPFKARGGSILPPAPWVLGVHVERC